MTQLSKGDTFSNGEQVTAARLNQLVDSATLNAGAITAQPNMAPNTLAADDSLLAYDLSDNTLREIKASDIVNSGLPLTTGSITGNAGSDIVVTPAATRKLLVSGNSDVTGNTNVGGSLTVSANSVFNGTGALKIPVGTTAERPSSPLSGQIRFNSTTTDAEIYDGSIWKAVGGGPFDASGGVITTVDGYKIHTFTVSGFFTPSLTKDGKVEVLVVGAGGAGSGFYPHGGGGGGGEVKTGFVTIAIGTTPMTVTVGVGVSGTGTSSSFGGITANGGGAGSGYTGGTSGSGIAGGGGDYVGAGGGAGAQATQTFKWTNAGGVGGQGFGSSISGTLTTYGGGGGGGSSGAGRASAPGINGGGGQGIAPAANSGGGGGGSPSNTLGADGIVIIRYRVS